MATHRRAVSLGGVVFDYPLYIAEYEAPEDFSAENQMSVAGSHVTYVARIHTPYITLLSKESGWLSKNTVDALRLLADSIGSIYTLTYENGDTENVRIAHEKKPLFTELFECSDDFLVTLPLAKTN